MIADDIAHVAVISFHTTALRRFLVEVTLIAYSCEDPRYTVTVESGFADATRWMVRGVLEYRTHLSSRAREHIEAEARLQLMIGIVRESRRGRDLGVRDVDILVEGDPETARFFRSLHGRSRAGSAA